MKIKINLYLEDGTLLYMMLYFKAPSCAIRVLPSMDTRPPSPKSSRCEETGHFSYNECGNTKANKEKPLPPKDGGSQAWMFLAASAMIEALVWGTSVVDHYSSIISVNEANNFKALHSRLGSFRVIIATMQVSWSQIW